VVVVVVVVVVSVIPPFQKGGKAHQSNTVEPL
jgi:hypothetical protein